MPATPGCPLDPLWEPFSVLLPAHPAVAPTHPLGCHRRRIADRVVFEHLDAAMVHGSGYERIASPGWSDRTMRRKVLLGTPPDWQTGCIEQVVLAQDDRTLGRDVTDLAVVGCITKAPGGGEKAGHAPVDRGNQGLKRSTVTDSTGIPLPLVSTGADRHDRPLLGPMLAGLPAAGPPTTGSTVHLHRAFDNAPSRTLPDELEFHGAIAC